jgi:coenzyme F420 hydrogenase subunit beta
MTDNEKSITWEFLKVVKDTLDSYRIRALIDAKEDIIAREIYSEEEYYDLLFNMFDLEQLKYDLFDLIKQKPIREIKFLKEFAQKKSIQLNLVFYLLELLKHEKLVNFDKIFTNDENDNAYLKEINVKAINLDQDRLKNVYEPVKVIFDAKVCSGCGMCVAVCPMKCIAMINGFGAINEDLCIKCGLCYLVCPRTILPTELLHMTISQDGNPHQVNKFGHFIEAYSARTKISAVKEICQDGGITTTCLYYLLDHDKIDIALGARMSEEAWKPIPFKIKSKEEALSCAGTKYVNNPNLSLLNDRTINSKKIAIVGVPCQMQALLKSRIYDFNHPRLKEVRYRIGIFCMESFPFKEGFLKICEILNVKSQDIKKADINKGKFIIFTHSGEELSIPMKEITHLARPDCELCYDLTSECADISVGSIGSPSGWNTILIRTAKGKELYEELIKEGLIESKKLEDVKPGLPLLERVAKSKKTKCNKHLEAHLAEKRRVPYY